MLPASMKKATGFVLNRRSALILALAAPMSSLATAHSMQEVEQELLKTEKYFQPVDSEAPDFALLDADGKAFRLASFKGKVVVLHFVYTNCPDVCPLHAEKIAAIQKMVNISPMRELVQFVTISVDPKNDQGQVLRDYAANHGLDPINWKFLTASLDEPETMTRDLAKSYGVEFMPMEVGHLMHWVLTVVIDQSGLLRARFHSLDFQNLNLVIFVDELIENHFRPPQPPAPLSLWDKMIQMVWGN
jgi:protein SCO1/2